MNNALITLSCDSSKEIIKSSTASENLRNRIREKINSGTGDSSPQRKQSKSFVVIGKAKGSPQKHTIQKADTSKGVNTSVGNITRSQKSSISVQSTQPKIQNNKGYSTSSNQKLEQVQIVSELEDSSEDENGQSNQNQSFHRNMEQKRQIHLQPQYHQNYSAAGQNQVQFVSGQPGNYYTSQGPLQHSVRTDQEPLFTQRQVQPEQGYYYYDGRPVMQTPNMVNQQPNQQFFPNQGYFVVTPRTPLNLPTNRSNPGVSPQQFIGSQFSTPHPSQFNQPIPVYNQEAVPTVGPFSTNYQQFGQNYVVHPSQEQLYHPSGYQGMNIQNYAIPQEQINPQSQFSAMNSSMVHNSYGNPEQVSSHPQPQVTTDKRAQSAHQPPTHKIFGSQREIEENSPVTKRSSSKKTPSNQIHLSKEHQVKSHQRQITPSKWREETEESIEQSLSTHSTPLRNNFNIPVPIEKQAHPNDIDESESPKKRRVKLEVPTDPTTKASDKRNGVTYVDSPSNIKEHRRQESQQGYIRQTNDVRQGMPQEQAHIMQNPSLQNSMTQLPTFYQNQSRELNTPGIIISSFRNSLTKFSLDKRAKNPHLVSKSVSFDEDSIARKEQMTNSSIQDIKLPSKRYDTNEMSPTRVARFMTSTPKHNDSSLDQTIPVNPSGETPNSRRSRNVSFRVSFGKTLREQGDRFDYIPSDVVNIDRECLTKKHLSTKQHSFDIISGLPKTGRSSSPSSRRESKASESKATGQ